jgi:hypothetical protein
MKVNVKKKVAKIKPILQRGTIDFNGLQLFQCSMTSISSMDFNGLQLVQ